MDITELLPIAAIAIFAVFGIYSFFSMMKERGAERVSQSASKVKRRMIDLEFDWDIAPWLIYDIVLAVVTVFGSDASPMWGVINIIVLIVRSRAIYNTVVYTRNFYYMFLFDLAAVLIGCVINFVFSLGEGMVFGDLLNDYINLFGGFCGPSLVITLVASVIHKIFD